MGMSLNFKWNSPPAAIASRIISPAVKLYAASEWHRLYNEFVPMQSGALAGTVGYLIEGKLGVVHHTSIYSHYQYAGTGFNFSRDKHPLASARWDQAAKGAGKGPALAKSIEGYLGR